MIKVDPDEHILINFLDLDMGKNGILFTNNILTFAMSMHSVSLWHFKPNRSVRIFFYLSIRSARSFRSIVTEDI